MKDLEKPENNFAENMTSLNTNLVTGSFPETSQKDLKHKKEETIRKRPSKSSSSTILKNSTRLRKPRVLLFRIRRDYCELVK